MIRRRLRTTLVTALLAATVLAPTPVAAQDATAQAPAPQIGARSAILVDLETGEVLFERNAREEVSVASLTKIMTALVARDLYTLDETVTVSRSVLQTGGGRLGLQPGDELTVRDLLYALMLRSANDAGTALAAHHPDGEAAFYTAMTETARSLGAESSSFANAHGLDEPGHLSSAWDMAVLGRRMLADPVLAEIAGTERYTLTWADGRQQTVRNHNQLLAGHEGTIGGKTGFTSRAGRCLFNAGRTEAGAALTVVLNSPDHYADTRALLRYHAASPVVESPELLAAPVRAQPEELLAAAMTSSSVARIQWVALPMLLLGGCMLLTLRRPRHGSPLVEAAHFHPFLEPLVSADNR